MEQQAEVATAKCHHPPAHSTIGSNVESRHSDQPLHKEEDGGRGKANTNHLTACSAGDSVCCARALYWHLRWLADGDLTDPSEAVRSYHSKLKELGIGSLRSLEEDLQSTRRGDAYSTRSS